MNGEIPCEETETVSFPNGESVSASRVVTAVMGEMKPTKALEKLLTSPTGTSEDDVPEPVEIPAFLQKQIDQPTILEEANNLIYGDRAAAYGHPLENFQNIATLWRAHILAAYGIDVPLTAVDAGWMQMQIKQARDMNMHKRDNTVDAAGYIGCVQKIFDRLHAEGEGNA